MADFRVGGLPAVRGRSTFPETNLRTYVRGPDGRDGLWFFSLEGDSLPTVLAARTAYGVPYRWADMTLDDDPTTVRYRSRRRRGPPPALTSLSGPVRPARRRRDSTTG